MLHLFAARVVRPQCFETLKGFDDHEGHVMMWWCGYEVNDDVDGGGGDVKMIKEMFDDDVDMETF